MAHVFLELAARLSVLLAARQTHEMGAVFESGDHHDSCRLVARRRMDVYRLGSAARHRASGRTTVADAARIGEGIRHLAISEHYRDFPFRGVRLDLFPRP